MNLKGKLVLSPLLEVFVEVRAVSFQGLKRIPFRLLPALAERKVVINWNFGRNHSHAAVHILK